MHAARPDGTVLEVSIYHNPEEDPEAEDDWALMLRALRSERFLGIVRRHRETEVDIDAIRALAAVFADAGIELTRTQRE